MNMVAANRSTAVGTPNVTKCFTQLRNPWINP